MNQLQTDPATGLPIPPQPYQQPTPQHAQTAQPIQPMIAGVPLGHIEQREHYIFTLPADLLPTTWSTSGHSDADRTFALTLLSASEEESALRQAGQGGTFDAGQLGKQWMLASVFAIGGKYTGRNYDRIMKWLDDIGPRCRKLVDKAFTHLHNITEKQGEDFLAGMQRAGQ